MNITNEQFSSLLHLQGFHQVPDDLYWSPKAFLTIHRAMTHSASAPSSNLLALVNNALLHSEDAANFELPIPIEGHTHFLSSDQHLIFCWDYVQRNYHTIPQQFDASFDELQMYADSYGYLLNKDVFRHLLEDGKFDSWSPSLP